MQVSAGGGMRSDINVTPLVDVVLVLLIIFMVITPVVQMGYLVKVPPKAPPMPTTQLPTDQIVLRRMADGRMMINKEVVPPEQFAAKMREVLKGNTGKMVFFAGDKDLLYDDAIKFLDLARSGGAHNIGIIVEELQQ
jgi:biopolymer transport protein TolR